jgi:hypothetical protein
MTTTTTPAAALVEARQISPDWQLACSIHTGLCMGQMSLPGGTRQEIKASMLNLRPHNREQALELVRRWHQLTEDARAFQSQIDTELISEVQS